LTPEPADVTAGRIRQAQQPVPSPPLLLDPDAGSTPSAEDADDGVVVYLCPCDPEGFLLAVDAGGNVRASRRLPSLTRQAVRDKAFMHFDAYDRRHQDLGSWERALEATTAWLWGSYAEQLLDCVPTTDQVTIVAGGLLGLLPIHAAWTWDDTRPSGRRYLIDETAVSYAPSRSLLRPSGAGPGSGTLLAISDPRPSRQRPLPWAAWESSVISEYFDRTVARTGSAATVDTPEQLYGTVEIRVVTRELVPHLPCGGEAVGPYPVAVLSRLAKGEY
jgi:CHAT domain